MPTDEAVFVNVNEASESGGLVCCGPPGWIGRGYECRADDNCPDQLRSGPGGAGGQPVPDDCRQFGDECFDGGRGRGPRHDDHRHPNGHYPVTLVMASLMITGGKVGTILGRRRAFALGLIIYAAGSLTTALAPDLGVLLLGWSLLEGDGAALVMPAVVSLVAANFPPERRAGA